MTSRQLYEGVLIELNKENAPNILLEDFNYFANKAINNYINKRYNIYDINLQTTDDLRVLKATALLTPKLVRDYLGLTMAGDDHMATYEVVMPSDYLHILNCICIYLVNKTYKCYNAGDTWRSPATRLTADMYSLVLDNFWNKPTYKKPYYYIHNVNTSNFIPTNRYGGKLFVLQEIGGIWYGNQNNSNNTNNSSSGATNISNSDTTNTLNGKFYIDDLTNSSLKTLYFGESIKSLHTLAIGNQLLAVNELGKIVKTDQITSDDNDNFYTVTENDNEYLITHDGLSITISKDSLINDTSNNSLDLGVDASSLSYVASSTLNEGSSFSSHFKYKEVDPYSYGTDAFGNDIVLGEGLPRTVDILENGNKKSVSNIERGQALRYGNVSLVRLEIRYGTDNQVFELKLVYIDYIKAPQNIRLTQQELDLTEDTSQMLEYPDYVCQEIINELVHLVMENISDLRLQTHPIVTLSIANPAQALAPQAQGLSAQ